MQKFIISVSIDDLIKANARFTDATQIRGPNAVDVVMTYPNGVSRIGIEGYRNTDAGTFVFNTTCEDAMDDVTGDYNALGLVHEVKEYKGRGAKVNVLDLLRAGFLLHAPVRRNVLRVQLPSEFDFETRKVEMNFRNDGTNLWAEFDNIDMDGTTTRADELEQLEMTLIENQVGFEVL